MQQDDVTPEATPCDIWDVLPLGQTEARDLVALSPKNDAGTRIQGVTGSGKTVLLRRLAISALSRGYEVIVIDAMRTSPSFLSPWLSGYSFDVAGAAAIMSDLVDELHRRRELLQREGVGFWADLPSKARQKNHITPLIIIVDSYEDFVETESQRGDHILFPEQVAEEESRNLDKVRVKVGLGRLLREGWSSGVSVVLAGQNLHASSLTAEMDANLTSRVVLTTRETSQQTISATFRDNALAVTKLLELNPPSHLGSAVISDSLGTRAFQVDFISESEALLILDALDIPKPRKRYGQR